MIDGEFPRNTALLRLLQYENAELPMLITLEGIVTLVRPLQ
jgi:hypothetical protein